ncbi:hypothetical protein ABZP36_007494 [Zizania latifolia]
MPCEKCRTKAMELVARAHGVISLAIAGDDKDKLEVIGDGVDVTCLVTCLRKKVGHAKIVLVEEVKDKKPDEKKPDDKKPEVCFCPPPLYCYGPPPPCSMVVCDDEPACSIM